MINIFDLLKKKSIVSIFDVAKYILIIRGEMSRLKLQSICYYCQAWSLVWDNKPLFEEEFRAWTVGPICLELFNGTKESFSITADDMPGHADNLRIAQKETIDAVLEYYADHNIQWLASLARSETPWKEVYELGCYNIITKESMASYYGSL